MSLAVACWSVLVADAPLAALLATYDGGPAVFTELPDDSPRPYVVCNPQFAAAPFDAKTRGGWDLSASVLCAVDDVGSRMTLRSISKVVRNLLHRPATALVIDGRPAFIAQVFGPIDLPSDDTVLADTLTVRAVYQEA